jgi:hypothetical protein
MALKFILAVNDMWDPCIILFLQTDRIQTDITEIIFVFISIRIRIRIVLAISDMIRIDIDIINMRFEYSDTVSDVEYSDLDKDTSKLL